MTIEERAELYREKYNSLVGADICEFIICDLIKMANEQMIIDSEISAERFKRLVKKLNGGKQQSK